MRATLNSLVELQKVDNELHDLEALKGDLPQQIQRLQDDLQQRKDEFENQKHDLEETRRLKLHWEGELADSQEKLKKYQEKLYAVTSNKEYDAITIEIDTVKEKIDEAETQILELIETEERLSEEVEKMETEVADLEENLRLTDTELQKKIQETEKETQFFRKQRQELTNHITKPVLYQYERIRKGLGKSAVVEISNYSCSGCFSAIPPQKAVEIKTMNQLIMCESCGRILVFSGVKNPVTT